MKTTNTTTSKIYLAGAMEKAFDNGFVWREKISPHLETLGYEVLNPCIIEDNAGITPAILKKYKKDNIRFYKNLATEIVDTDLKYVNECDIIICKLDKNVLSGAGTYGELTLARFLKKPVYAWIDTSSLSNGIRDLPVWCVGCLTDYMETSTLENFSSALKIYLS